MTSVRFKSIDPSERAELDSLVEPHGDHAHFVHYSWFWFDRAQHDTDICVRWIMQDDEACGVIAFGPHEPIDMDRSSRVDDIGEIYHLVIDHRFLRQGIARAAISLAIQQLKAQREALTAVAVAHHPDNEPAALLYQSLGFQIVGQKADAETGEAAVLRMFEH